MRIISGTYKGKRLTENKFEHIRPTADMVKQALFTKLQFEISGAKVLDLFCGTGSLGIEAVSRGAEKVVFVDSNLDSVRLTKKNLTGLVGNVKVYQSDAVKFLKGCKEKFDLVLIDPPYRKGVYHEVLESLHKCGALEHDGIIVCECLKDEKINSECFEIYDEKRYGSKKLVYLKNFF